MAKSKKQEGFKLRVPADERTKDKCAIVGFTDHRVQALQLGDEWELWGINELHRVPGCDWEKFARWFEVHPRKDIDADAQHIETMGKMDIPIYMQVRHADIPASVPFPREAIMEHFGVDYFTSSIAWQMAMAIMMGFKEIHVYGVDMATDCLAPDTKVLTADLRWVRADEVRVGDDLLGFDEEPGDGAWAVSEEIHALAEENGCGVVVAAERTTRKGRNWRVAKVQGRSTAMRPSYRIHFEDGTTIVASAGHQWLTYGEHAMRWKRTDELAGSAHRPGRPTRVVRVLDTWEEDHSWEAGYLAAAFDGEGHLRQRKHPMGGTHTLGLGFSQRENAMADRVRMAMALKGFEWGELHGAGTHENVTNFTVKGGRPALLRFLGQVRPERLLAKFDPAKIGQMQKHVAVAVTSIEPLGEVETVGFTTSTATLFAEGFASHNSEYAEQRACCEFWIGMARGQGIEVYVPPTSDLCKAVGQYGFGETGTEFALKLAERIAWLHGQDNDFLTQIRGIEAEYPKIKAKLEAERHEKMAAIDAEYAGKLQALDSEYQQKHGHLSAQRNQVYGAILDCNFWKRSWAVPISASREFSPDRTKDPRIGLAEKPLPEKAEDRILAGQAA